MDDLASRLKTERDGYRDALREANAEIAQLREALRRIANHLPGVTHYWADEVRRIAKNALGNDDLADRWDNA